MGIFFTQLASDNFNRPNENPLSGGGNWVLPGPATPLQIISDVVESTILSNYGVEYFNGGISWPNDQYSEVVFKTLANSNQFAGPLVRQHPTAATTIITNYEVAPEGPLGAGTTLFLVKHIAGAQTILATLTATLNPGDYLRLAVQGTTLSVYINGVLVPGSVVIDSSVASGFPGVFAQPITSLSNVQISSWFGGSVNNLPSISGNVQAVNARLRLRSTAQIQPEAFVDTYSDANGNYTFSNVALGNYQIIVDLNECMTAPYNSGYSYRNPRGVTVTSAGSLTDINFTPVLLNAANPNYNQF